MITAISDRNFQWHCLNRSGESSLQMGGKKVCLKWMVILKSLQEIDFFIRMAFTHVFFTHISSLCPISFLF